MMLFLLLETGMFGVFASLDLFCSSFLGDRSCADVFPSSTSGAEKIRRAASFKFFVYTMRRIAGVVAFIQLIGLTTGTFDIVVGEGLAHVQ